MEDAGLSDGDLIIMDRSLCENNKIVVCFLDGEFTVKRLIKKVKTVLKARK